MEYWSDGVVGYWSVGVLEYWEPITPLLRSGNATMSEIPTRRPIPAVAAVIVQDDRLLLIKRGVEPSKGKWSIPGGSIEWGETLEDALKREVREETGLEIEVGAVAGVFDLITGAYHYVIIDYFARPIGGELRPGDDASDARWIALDELDSYELTDHLRERLAEMGIHNP